MGLGTVGRAFLRALADNREDIGRRLAEPLEVTRILVRDPTRHPEERDRLTTEARDILDDPDISVVVEVMGGREPARTYMLEALRRGKSVVTANKEVLAYAGPELWAAAEAGQADLRFEASVGGGIPVVQGLTQGLAADRVQSVVGIVNGTTNYILTRMTDEGSSFEQALAAAQAAGYAEADPTDDLDGHDAARKIAILASIAFGAHVSPDDVAVEGIRHVTAEDIRYGQGQGWRLKVLASARLEPDGLMLRVAPTFLPQDHPLAGVSGAYNAILVEGEPVGRVMFFGPGAGGGPTASAVLGDVIEIAWGRHQGVSAPRPVRYRPCPLKDPATEEMAAYWRLDVVDRPGTLAQVAQALSDASVSLRSVEQRPKPDGRATLLLVTHRCREGALRQAVANAGRLPVVLSMGPPIRVEGVD